MKGSTIAEAIFEEFNCVNLRLDLGRIEAVL
jgi:hypothetical protein